jgi:hypothetical protein
MENVKTEIKYLQCTLTEEELKKYSQNLARVAQEKNEIEGRKKQAMSDFNAQIASKEADITTFATKVNNGWEYRDVECEWLYDWDAGTKTLYRKDTDECLAIAIPVDDDDRQGMLV